MVQELRRIILSKSELLSALETYAHATPNFFPRGRIIDIFYADKVGVTVIISDEPNGADKKILLNDAKLLQPVIRFCLESNVMLPRTARKSVLITKQNVSLCVAIDDNLMVTPEMNARAVAIGTAVH